MTYSATVGMYFSQHFFFFFFFLIFTLQIINHLAPFLCVNSGECRGAAVYPTSLFRSLAAANHFVGIAFFRSYFWGWCL